ncbi:starch phosphorylase [Catalinimonas alkaloidigena]|uniref:Starch phosphorylase n=1 Tax=Catalinimonas alkaloidigena TaxID=1075417 RepID=A0A1G9BBX3_9BACT|nr:alpha-glucan family phosphorylase [Catalinimonas alkaloidigena]SDK36987.1 starch phosphorylase [Catalinimonas alkaloidigena]
MEFAIHQSLKTYSGGLGFLAGSHMRSAYELKQNMIGIGMLWKYGYYDQVRTEDNTMKVLFRKKYYNFLEDSGIMVPVYVNNHQIYVKALYLRPEVFNTIPMYFLTTDIDENDHLAQTITHRLYDSNTATRIAQNLVLGVGGAKVVDALGGADIYHMNEGHALPLTFHLYQKFGHDLNEVKKRVCFTTHTPEKAGNEEHNIYQLHQMGFFSNLPLEEVRQITGIDTDSFSHSLAALRLCKIANGVSELHGKVSRDMWGENSGIAKIIHITNAQNKTYWADKQLAGNLASGDDEALFHRKKHLKKRLFETVADQTGKIFDKDVLTIVWARRFAEYKRADLIKRDIMRFNRLINNDKYPVQIIWAGKPYPFDYNAISRFDHLVTSSYKTKNTAVLVGYELALSMLLKQGADIWLNTPRRPREASGTSGMTAAMNGAINFSISDGWVPEFAEHGKNAFIIPPTDPTLPIDQQDTNDYENLMGILENEILPLYYDRPKEWEKLVKRSMLEVTPRFDSNRMADEYYELMYDYHE